MTNKLKPKIKIPFLSTPDQPLTNATQNFLPIADISDDLILYKDGGAAIVMESTSLNFGLLSEKEQEAVIFSYAAMINSLSFPLQIVIRSQRKDISSYIEYLNEARQKIRNPKLLALMQSYGKFIDETVKKKNVLGKSFYMILYFSSLELGITKFALSLTKKNGGALPYPKSLVIKKAKIALCPKRDHLMTQARRLGIRLRQLSASELIDLFYKILNSEPPTKKTKTQLEPQNVLSISQNQGVSQPQPT